MESRLIKIWMEIRSKEIFVSLSGVKILRFFEKRGFNGRKARHDYANDTHREARIRPFLLLILIRYVSLWKKMEIETILLFFLFFSRTRRFANVLLA